MNRFLAVLIVLLLVFSSGWLMASGSGEAQEEYDEDTYGPKDPVIWVKPVRSVIFEHKIHTMDAGLECDSCHDDLFVMEAGAAEENEDFTMAAMYDGAYCGACHDGSTAFAANTRCTTCHIGVRGHARLVGGSAAAAPSH